MGMVSYRREYYYDPDARRGEYPLDDRLGVTGEVSVEVERMVVKLCAQLPYETSVGVLEELAQIGLASATAWRKTQAAGERAIALEAAHTDKTRKTSVQDVATDPRRR